MSQQRRVPECIYIYLYLYLFLHEGWRPNALNYEKELDNHDDIHSFDKYNGLLLTFVNEATISALYFTFYF